MKILLSLILGISLYGGNFVGLTNSQVKSVQKMIQLYGYKCDVVNYASRSAWDGSIDATCNNGKYSYDLEDKGGRWIVTID